VDPSTPHNSYNPSQMFTAQETDYELKRLGAWAKPSVWG
jgi:hypothetical protein